MRDSVGKGCAQKRELGDRVQLAKQDVIDVLRKVGLPELVDEALRVLPTRLIPNSWRNGASRTVLTWLVSSTGWAAVHDAVCRDPDQYRWWPGGCAGQVRLTRSR